jgi:hypothetical protein
MTAQPAYWAEEFTDTERARLAPYVTNLDRPVFALRNLPETVKGPCSPATPARQDPAPAVPGRVRRRRRSSPARGARRRAPRSPGRQARADRAVPAGLRRLRRRQRGPAGRGPRGLRAGLQPAHQAARVGPAGRLPGAVDALCLLRRPARGRWRYHLDPDVDASDLGPSTGGCWTGCSPPTPSCSRPSPSTWAGSCPTSRVERGRLAPGRQGQALDALAACCRPPPLPTWASSPPGRRTRRSCCGCGPRPCLRPGPTPTCCSRSCAR